MKKVYPDKNNEITVSCPLCSKTRDIDATPFLKKEGPAKLIYRFKCSYCDCGHKNCDECTEENCANGNSNSIVIERRKFFRTKVNLPGLLRDEEGTRYSIRVLDLSRTGVRTKIFKNHSFQIDQKLLVEFTLNDSKETVVEKFIKVRKSEGKTVDGEFLETDSYDKNDRAIGFYLMK